MKKSRGVIFSGRSTIDVKIVCKAKHTHLFITIRKRRTKNGSINSYPLRRNRVQGVNYNIFPNTSIYVEILFNDCTSMIICSFWNITCGLNFFKSLFFDIIFMDIILSPLIPSSKKVNIVRNSVSTMPASFILHIVYDAPFHLSQIQ